MVVRNATQNTKVWAIEEQTAWLRIFSRREGKGTEQLIYEKVNVEIWSDRLIVNELDMGNAHVEEWSTFNSCD